MSEDIRLDVAVIVLASPDEASRGFDDLGDHVVNQAMFVVDGIFVEVACNG